MSCYWFLFHGIQAALTGVPRARCQATKTARHTVTLSLISVTPCHRSMPRSHAIATHLRGSTGSCGTGQSGRRKRRRSAYWNAWQERRKAARPATGGVRAALETCVPPTPLVETHKQTLTRSAPTTNPGTLFFFLLCMVPKMKTHRTTLLQCTMIYSSHKTFSTILLALGWCLRLFLVSSVSCHL